MVHMPTLIADGASHFSTSSDKVGSAIVRCVLWLVALGAVSPFCATALGARLRRRRTRWFWVVLSVIVLATFVFGRLVVKQEPALDSLLRALFLAAGIATMAEVLGGLGRKESEINARDEDDQRILLGLWLFGAALFVVFFSPFMAVRHLLPALPAVLLLLARLRLFEPLRWPNPLKSQ
jgi:hypothetical protein